MPLLLAEAYGWNFSYAVMAALMTIGILAVLAAPREMRHAIREIQTGDIQPAPAREAIEWIVRLVVLAAGALVLGSGLAANAGVLARVLGAAGATGARDAVLSAWASDAPRGVSSGCWLTGFCVIVSPPALPLPGARTRPGVYLSSALADPLRDFFGATSQCQADSRVDLPLSHSGFRVEHHESVYSPRLHPCRDREVRKIFGVGHDDAGLFAGRKGGRALRLLTAMVIGGFAEPLSNLLFIWLAIAGPSPSRSAAIGLDKVAGGFAGTCADRVHVEPDIGRVHGHAVRALLVSVARFPAGDCVAVGRIVEGAARIADAAVFFGLEGIVRDAGARQFRCCCRTIGSLQRPLAQVRGLLRVFSAHRGIRAGAFLRVVAAVHPETEP